MPMAFWCLRLQLGTVQPGCSQLGAPTAAHLPVQHHSLLTAQGTSTAQMWAEPWGWEQHSTQGGMMHCRTAGMEHPSV